MNKLAAILLLTATLQAQDNKPVLWGSCGNLCGVAIASKKWNFAFYDQQGKTSTWSERVTKEGVYESTFSDPTGKWRCRPVAHQEFAGGQNVTIVCSRDADLEKEK